MGRILLIPLATALPGLTLLAAMTLQPQPGATRHALLFPPWVSRTDAPGRAAALGLPVTDIRQRGRLIVLSAAPPDSPVAGMQALSARVINPSVAALCIAPLPPEEPFA